MGAKRATSKPRKGSEAWMGAEAQAVIAEALGMLERASGLIQRVAKLPDRKGAAAMEDGKRPYSLLQWVIYEARNVAADNRLSQDIRVLADVPNATQAGLDEQFRRDPAEYPIFPLGKRRRRGESTRAATKGATAARAPARSSIEARTFELWGLDKVPGGKDPAVRALMERRIRALRLACEVSTARAMVKT